MGKKGKGEGVAVVLMHYLWGLWAKPVHPHWKRTGKKIYTRFKLLVLGVLE